MKRIDPRPRWAPAAAPLLLSGLLLVGLAGGCDLLVDGQGDPAAREAAEPAVPAAAAATEKKKDPLDAAIEAAEQYSYNPIGKRDPFRSFLNFDSDDKPGPGTLPTQKYEIDQYKLAGLVWGVDRPRALVEDADGMGHVLEIGTYIGKNWGKVTQITSGEVIVTEEYQTLDGELVVNNISLTLPVGDSAALVQ